MAAIDPGGNFDWYRHRAAPGGVGTTIHDGDMGGALIRAIHWYGKSGMAADKIATGVPPGPLAALSDGHHVELLDWGPNWTPDPLNPGEWEDDLDRVVLPVRVSIPNGTTELDDWITGLGGTNEGVA